MLPQTVPYSRTLVPLPVHREPRLLEVFAITGMTCCPQSSLDSGSSRRRHWSGSVAAGRALARTAAGQKLVGRIPQQGWIAFRKEFRG